MKRRMGFKTVRKNGRGGGRESVWMNKLDKKIIVTSCKK